MTDICLCAGNQLYVCDQHNAKQIWIMWNADVFSMLQLIGFIYMWPEACLHVQGTMVFHMALSR